MGTSPIHTNTWAAVKAMEVFIRANLQSAYSAMLEKEHEEGVIDFPIFHEYWDDQIACGDEAITNVLWNRARFEENSTVYEIDALGGYSANAFILPIQDVALWLRNYKGEELRCWLGEYKDNKELYDSLSSLDGRDGELLSAIKEGKDVMEPIESLWTLLEWLLYRKVYLAPAEGEPFFKIDFADAPEEILECLQAQKREYLDCFIDGEIEWRQGVVNWETNRQHVLDQLSQLSEQTDDLWIEHGTLDVQNDRGLAYKPIETLLVLEMEGLLSITEVYAPRGGNIRMRVAIEDVNRLAKSSPSQRGRPPEAKMQKEHIFCGKKSIEIPKNAPKLRRAIPALMELTASKAKDEWIIGWDELCEATEGNTIALDGTGKEKAKERMRNDVRAINRLLSSVGWQPMLEWNGGDIRRLY